MIPTAARRKTNNDDYSHCLAYDLGETDGLRFNELVEKVDGGNR